MLPSTKASSDNRFRKYDKEQGRLGERTKILSTPAKKGICLVTKASSRALRYEIEIRTKASTPIKPSDVEHKKTHALLLIYLWENN
jgi:hypothetical protein